MMPPSPNSQVRPLKKHHSQIPVSLIASQLPLPIRSLHQGLVIAGRFKLIEKIGQGSFGSIFKTENLETGEVCATKLEKREDSQGGMQLLVREIKVLMEIKGCYGTLMLIYETGFPEISFYGRDENYNYFMASYLGYNFESLIRKCGGKFSMMTTLQLASQMMNRIEVFHSKNLIHRDIKPENFVLGNIDISALFMIDFGLSKYFKDTHQKHIPWVEKKGIIGTARYASINAHLGNEQSRRDDLEGIGYVLLYFAKGKLPWQNIAQESKYEKYSKILEYKQQLSVDQLCEGIPKCFNAYFQNVKALSFTETPNYTLLKNLFQAQIQELDKSERFVCFDWEKLSEFKGKKGSIKAHSPKLTKNTGKSPRHKIDDSPLMLKGTTDRIEENKKMDRSPKGKNMTLINTMDKAKKNSFLMVPLLKEEPNNKTQKSITDSRAVSIDTSRCNNYQMSNINMIGLTKEDLKTTDDGKLALPGRKDVRALTISNPKGGAFFREALSVNPQQQQLLVDEEYADFDNIHELAEDDDLQLNVVSFQVKRLK